MLSLNNKTIKTGITIAIIVGVGIFLCLYYFINPEDSILMPKCMFHELTGYKCVGCGMQRAIYHALHGNFAEALRMNYAISAIAPLLILYAYAELTRFRNPRLHNALSNRYVISALALLVIAWWIGRNIAGI